MKTIEDVRRCLWKAYSKITKDPNYYGKSSEAYVEVQYPNFWAVDNEEDFLKPEGLMIYSYALGPSRTHYFNFGKKESHPNYYTWVSSDPYAKAVEVIEGWLKEWYDEDNS